MMKRRVFYFLLFLIFGACVEPFEAHVDDGQQQIVVDGLITDQPGPYSVDIFKTAKLTSPYEKREYVVGATVTVFDDEGGSEQLVDKSKGHYETTSIQGEIGKTYYIRIVLPEGATYESVPEKILPAGDFSNLRSTFKQPVSPGSDDDLVHPRNGFNVFLDAEITPEQEGRVRWRWNGTFEIFTHPELRTRIAAGPVLRELPDPYPCSGWVVPRGQTDMMQTGDCTCCTCWATLYNPSPLISDTKFANNNKIDQVSIGFIPASRRFFYDKYYLTVEQMSVSENAYKFWKAVTQQANQGSDLFQTPASPTTGNIKLVSGTGDPIIGLFGASAIVSHSFVINRTQVPYLVPPLDTLKVSCLEVYRYSTTTQPSFW